MDLIHILNSMILWLLLHKIFCDYGFKIDSIKGMYQWNKALWMGTLMMICQWLKFYTWCGKQLKNTPVMRCYCVRFVIRTFDRILQELILILTLVSNDVFAQAQKATIHVWHSPSIFSVPFLPEPHICIIWFVHLPRHVSSIASATIQMWPKVNSVNNFLYFHFHFRRFGYFPLSNTEIAHQQAWDIISRS